MKHILTLLAITASLTFGACASKTCPASKSSCCASGTKSDCSATGDHAGHTHAKKK